MEILKQFTGPRGVLEKTMQLDEDASYKCGGTKFTQTRSSNLNRDLASVIPNLQSGRPAVSGIDANMLGAV